MNAPYRMVRADGSHEIEIKKSRFICHLFRVTSEGEARQHIETVRKEHWNANHNCTAWIIGEGQASQRSSDDGEPSGTAGMPMLEVLRKRGVTDTLAIVTRYFGGIMLGAGGLIRAYGGAVSETLDSIGIVERKPLAIVQASASYDDAGRIENAIRAKDLPLTDVAYTTDVRFELAMPESEVEPFATWLQELTNGGTHATIVGERYVEVTAPLLLIEI
ncbi:MAG: YigZ family protein [Thermomicrobiales bacterium]|nr:YigZ family protein [Thermomicrobiales bacterium]MCO5219361.1 YigZ family protein [Thermomicrobiales bacterium]MCO5225782.1 YigZ family protein [Thermomicrobiales bacterium]MCO5227551.1 YigZ family protein [Thermomicrobiales bacterium]